MSDKKYIKFSKAKARYHGTLDNMVDNIVMYINIVGSIRWEILDPELYSVFKKKYKDARKGLGVSRDDIEDFVTQSPGYISRYSKRELDILKQLEVL